MNEAPIRVGETCEGELMDCQSLSHFLEKFSKRGLYRVNVMS